MSSEQGFLKLIATETYTMTSEESAKRILRLAGFLRDTREPRGPEHMAKMKAARGPYSDPRDTYIARTIRYAFESFQRQAPVDGSVGERDLRLAASCGAQQPDFLRLESLAPERATIR